MALIALLVGWLRQQDGLAGSPELERFESALAQLAGSA